jgi:hypothetical protein
MGISVCPKLQLDALNHLLKYLQDVSSNDQIVLAFSRYAGLLPTAVYPQGEEDAAAPMDLKVH